MNSDKQNQKNNLLWVEPFSYSANTKEGILNLLSRDPQLKAAIKNITQENKFYSDELTQELFIELCKIPEQTIIEHNNKKYLFFFVLKVLTNQFHSNKSTFYRKIKRNEINSSSLSFSEENTELDQYFKIIHKESGLAKLKEILPNISSFIQTLHWYDKKVLEDYIAEPKMSTRKLAKKYGIPHSSIHLTLTKVYNLIRQYLKDNNLHNF